MGGTFDTRPHGPRRGRRRGRGCVRPSVSRVGAAFGRAERCADVPQPGDRPCDRAIGRGGACARPRPARAREHGRGARSAPPWWIACFDTERRQSGDVVERAGRDTSSRGVASGRVLPAGASCGRWAVRTPRVACEKRGTGGECVRVCPCGRCLCRMCGVGHRDREDSVSGDGEMQGPRVLKIIKHKNNNTTKNSQNEKSENERLPVACRVSCTCRFCRDGRRALPRPARGASRAARRAGPFGPTASKKKRS